MREGAPPPARVDSLPASRRWLFRLLAMVAVPAVVVLLLEFALRVVGYGYDPRFFLPKDIGGERYLVQNDQFSRRFFPPETLRHPGALRMRAVKPAGSIRIFVLGESAAMGDPEPAFGPARYMEMALRQRYPGTDLEVVNVAFTAINSHVILPIARECARHDGDLWLVYMGNNEVVGPFGASSAFGAKAPPLPQVRASIALQRWRCGQLINDLGRRLRAKPSDYASWGGMEMFLGNQVAASDPARVRVRDHFRRNLEDIVAAGAEAGAAVLLNTVAVNLKDSPPFASVLNGHLGDATRKDFEQQLAAARAAVADGNPDLAAGRFAAAATLDAQCAAVRYEWGRALLQSTNRSGAREQLQRACDEDALAFRTDSRLNGIMRDTARQWEARGVRLLDAVTELERYSPDGIVGDESLYEHVHFNFDGAYRLGLAWAREGAAALADRLPGPAVEDWASQAECDRQLGLTDWNRKFVIDSMIRRLQQPPLSGQANNESRLRGLQDRERELMAGMNEVTAAAARSLYAAALSTRPDDHYLHEALGGFQQATGDLAGATRSWQQVRDLMPQDFLPWFQVGVLSARQGRQVEAQASLRLALEMRPELIEGWSELGQSYGAAQNWPAALACFEKVCALRPQDAIPWAYQAKVLGELGRRAEAIQCYRRALALNQDYAEAHGALGDLLAQNGDFGAALEEYQAAMRLRPTDVTATFNSGVMLLRLGRRVEGQQALQKVLELNPDHPLAREYLARLEAGAAANSQR